MSEVILKDNDCESCDFYHICPVDQGEKCIKEGEDDELRMDQDELNL